VGEGGDAEFTCKFVSSPLASKIIWFKNETEELTPNDNLQIESTEQTSILKLLKCSSNDNGNSYQCKIVNDLGDAISNKALLNITRGPIFELEPQDQKVLKDKEVKYECIIKANPKPTVSWLMNGKEITNKDGIRVEKDANKDKYSIVIPKVAINASFTVKANNEFGTIEKTVELDVLEAPKSLNKLDNITVNEGESAKYTIKLGGKPKPQVKWFKDDEEIITNEEYEIIETSEDEVSLIIKSCKSPNNLGNYYAKLINEHGEITTNKSIITINRSPKFLSQPSNSVAVLDTTAKFECVVDANPKPKLIWLLNDKELTVKDNVKFEVDAKTTANILVIPKVTSLHVGTFTIKASNSVGEIEHKFNLIVNGKI
jgi:hypothetical protein